MSGIIASLKSNSDGFKPYSICIQVKFRLHLAVIRVFSIQGVLKLSISMKRAYPSRCILFLTTLVLEELNTLRTEHPEPFESDLNYVCVVLKSCLVTQGQAP